MQFLSVAIAGLFLFTCMLSKNVVLQLSSSLQGHRGQKEVFQISSIKTWRRKWGGKQGEVLC